MLIFLIIAMYFINHSILLLNGARNPPCKRWFVLQSILDPNADISHGYDGYELTTTDGIKVQGVLVSQGNPVLMKSMGGQIQAIPKNRIDSVRRVNRSLMMWPAQLGLTAQDVADVTAYIQALGRE